MSTPIDLDASGLLIDTPWYRQISPEQWRALWATFFGWVLDAFDFNILAFVLVDIQKSFSVDRALVGALGSVTLAMRVVGGIAAGVAADKVGRKLPLILSILWFSVFAFLSGFSRSYSTLFLMRALFGIGMGGEWAAGTPLALEHWPTRLRGVASGMLQSGWNWGYLLAAAAFQFVYPIFNSTPHLGWRVMFWIAIIPALFTLWIRAGVSESPVWLEHRRSERKLPNESRISLVRIFQRDLIGTTLQTTALMCTFMGAFYSMGFWYPTFLRDSGRATLPYLAAFNLGAIAGVAAWGSLSETSLGRRGAVATAALLGLASIPLYLYAPGSLGLILGALTMGAFGVGIWGMAPAYVTEQFPTEARAVGPGFCYHAAAVVGSVMPLMIGAMQDRGTALPNAMTIGIALSLVACILVIWSAPETRGRNFYET